jgi:hypothetical protein
MWTSEVPNMYQICRSMSNLWTGAEYIDGYGIDATPIEYSHIHMSMHCSRFSTSTGLCSSKSLRSAHFFFCGGFSSYARQNWLHRSSFSLSADMMRLMLLYRTGSSLRKDVAASSTERDLGLWVYFGFSPPNIAYWCRWLHLTWINMSQLVKVQSTDIFLGWR